jgi:hypothetical protein
VREVARDKSALLAAWQEAGYLHAEVTPEARVRATTSGKSRSRSRSSRACGRAWARSWWPACDRRAPRSCCASWACAAATRSLPAKLLEAQRTLQGLGIFERVSVRELLGGSGDSAPLVIEVEEASRASVAYGLGYAERDLLRGSVEVTLRNLMGMDRSLSSFARVSFRGSRLVANYREPRPAGKKQELFLTAFREEQDRDAFDFVRAGGQVQRRAQPVAAPDADRAPDVSAHRRVQRDRAARRDRPPVPQLDLLGAQLDARLRQPRRPAGSQARALRNRRPGPVARGGGRRQLLEDVRAGRQLHPRPARAPCWRVAELGSGWRAAFSNAPARAAVARPLLRRRRLQPARVQDRLRGAARAGHGRASCSRPAATRCVLGGVELRRHGGARFEVAGFVDLATSFSLASEVDLGELRYSAGVGLRYKSSIRPDSASTTATSSIARGRNLPSCTFTVGMPF